LHFVYSRPVDNIVIIGAGHAGGRAALGLREAGWNGPVLLIGAERDPPCERSPLSKAVLLGETQCDHQLQIAGDPSLGVETVTRPLVGGSQLDFHLGVDGRMLGVAGFGPVSSLVKEFKLARILFERGAKPAPASLADPSVELKSLF
jgi:hypothetical protein